MILKATNSYLSFLQRLQRYLFCKRDKNLQLLRPLSPQTAGWYITLSNLFLQVFSRDPNPFGLGFLYNLMLCSFKQEGKGERNRLPHLPT